MDRISNAPPQGHPLRGLDDDRGLRVGVEGRTVQDLSAVVERGDASLHDVERALLDAGRVGDIYELSRELKAGGAATAEVDRETTERLKAHGKENGNNGKHDYEELLAAMTFIQSTLTSQSDCYAAPVYGFEYDTPDPTAPRQVGDRLVFDTGSTPSSSVKLGNAEAADLEHRAAPHAVKTDEA